MFSICFRADERQRYLEAAFTAPEELLDELNVPVGILGIKRKYFDPMLKPKEISTTKKRDSIMKPIPEFVIPTKEKQMYVIFVCHEFVRHIGTSLTKS